MKYIAFKIVDKDDPLYGSWIVANWTGRERFPNMVSNNRQRVHEWALLQSMAYYKAQMEDAWANLLESADTNEYGDQVKLVGSDDYCDMGDFTC